MSHIPTVRVANPVDSTAYMTINASDYRPLVHGNLWHEQHPDFDGLPPAPPASYSEGERRFAADLLLETVAFRELVMNDREFHALSPAERMTVLRDARNEFERSRDEFAERRKRDSQVSEQQHAQERRTVAMTASERERLANLVGDEANKQPVPGETPGHPVDATTGKPLGLTDEQRAALAENKLDPQAAPAGNELGQAQAAATTAAPTPAQAPVEAAKPAWAAAKPAEPPQQPSTTVEKGVGGKFYVMRGGKPLSPGFAKKADADAALPEYSEQLAS